MESLGKQNSMSFEQAESLWTLRRTTQGTEEWAKMNEVLNDFINADPGYDGIMYRGVYVKGVDSSNIMKSMDILREKFKMGKTINGAVNEHSQDFVSWSADMLTAYNYAGDKDSQVILVNEEGIKNGRMLPGTKGELGMKEVLTKKNIKYQVGNITYGKVEGTNEKAFLVYVHPLEKKRR